MKYTFESKQTINITPSEIAKLFCNMDADEQAIFFNVIASEIKLWENPFCFQLQAVTDSPELLDEARKVMKEIGEYAYNTK